MLSISFGEVDDSGSNSKGMPKSCNSGMFIMKSILKCIDNKFQNALTKCHFSIIKNTLLKCNKLSQNFKITFFSPQLEPFPYPFEPPNDMVRVKDHALPDTQTFCSVWKGMPFSIKMPFNIYLDALPCPSEPRYDMVEHRRACPSRHY